MVGRDSQKKCPVCKTGMTQTNRAPPPETWLCPKCGFKLVSER
jgi:ribosomal protein L37AE/L43A